MAYLATLQGICAVALGIVFFTSTGERRRGSAAVGLLLGFCCVTLCAWLAGWVGREWCAGLLCAGVVSLGGAARWIYLRAASEDEAPGAQGRARLLDLVARRRLRGPDADRIAGPEPPQDA
jgi:hypothetical protein